MQVSRVYWQPFWMTVLASAYQQWHVLRQRRWCTGYLVRCGLQQDGAEPIELTLKEHLTSMDLLMAAEQWTPSHGRTLLRMSHTTKKLTMLMATAAPPP